MKRWPTMPVAPRIPTLYLRFMRFQTSLYPLHSFSQGIVVSAERYSQKSFALAAKRYARYRDNAGFQQSLRHFHRGPKLAYIDHRIERAVRRHRPQPQLVMD